MLNKLLFALILTALTTLESHSMDAQPDLEKQVWTLRDQTMGIAGIKNGIAAAKCFQLPIDEALKERVRNLWIPEDLRGKYGAAKLMHDHLHIITSRATSLARKMNLYPDNNDDLDALDTIGSRLLHHKKFIEAYEFLVNEISKMKTKVLGEWDGQRFSEVMLKPISFN